MKLEIFENRNDPSITQCGAKLSIISGLKFLKTAT